MVNTLLVIKISPTWKRLLIVFCQEKKQIFYIGVAIKLAVLVSWHNSSGALVLIFLTASEELAP